MNWKIIVWIFQNIIIIIFKKINQDFIIISFMIRMKDLKQ